MRAIRLDIRVNKREREMLREIEERTGLNASTTVRTAIYRLHAETCAPTPMPSKGEPK